jgi:hypothetical protein
MSGDKCRTNTAFQISANGQRVSGKQPINCARDEHPVLTQINRPGRVPDVHSFVTNLRLVSNAEFCLLFVECDLLRLGSELSLNGRPQRIRI